MFLKMLFLLLNFFRASGEAILGTQRYFSMPYSQRSLDLGFQKNLAACEPNERNRLELKNRNPGKRRFKKKKEKGKEKEKDCTLKLTFFLLKIVRASGEAILGTQRYLATFFAREHDRRIG